MAGDGASHGEVVSVPLQPCSWAAAAGVGVGEGQMLKADGSSSAVPTGEDGRCSTTRRKAAVVSQAKKPSDSMAVDECDDDDGDWVYIGRDENSNLVVVDLVIDNDKDPELLEHHLAGLDENGDLIMDKELLELREWVKTSLDIANLLRDDDDPCVTFWSDVVYSDDDESEEVCSEAQHQFEMMSIKY